MLLVGHGKSQGSVPAPESKPVLEVLKQEPLVAKATDMSIDQAVHDGKIQAVEKHLVDEVILTRKVWNVRESSLLPGLLHGPEKSACRTRVPASGA